MTGRPPAPAYAGTLDDRHLRAVVRSALRARGFHAAAGELAASAARQRETGLRLAAGALPARRPPYVPDDPYAPLRADPQLAERFPLMAALGFRQAQVVHAAAAGPSPAPEPLALLGAAFNTAIALLDHLVDDRGMQAEVFDLVDEALVARLFAGLDEARGALEAAYHRAAAPLLRALVALVGTCREEVEALRPAGGGGAAWKALAHAVMQLFAAQRDLALAPPEGAAYPAALRRKSAGPTEVVYLAARLPLGEAGPPPPWVGELGLVFSLADDLVDVLRDDRRGEPNTLLHARGEAPPRLTDPALYALVESGADELAGLVSSLAASSPSPSLADFAREVVALWTGWLEDAAPAAPPAPPLPEPAADAARRALGALLEHQRDGFRRAAHHLRFPRLTPDGVRHETHAALLSFRAVALDALLDARDAGLVVPCGVLHAEALALLRAKHPLVRGGWSYVQDAPELPPDADDLGQVLQVLSRLGGPALAASGEEAARLAVDAMRPDGGVSTWIIDPRGASPADDAVRAYLPVMGGWGVHDEVVANLGYGLFLFDRERFEAPLERICRYLVDAQRPDGSWASMWYQGPFYGTWRALALLAAMDRGPEARRGARDFLLARQTPEGGWGSPGADPLSTAFALLALGAGGGAPAAAASAAAAFLAAAQRPDGAWAEVPWIRFPTLDGPVVYGSEAMTTAFALKALVSAALPSPGAGPPR